MADILNKHKLTELILNLRLFRGVSREHPKRLRPGSRRSRLMFGAAERPDDVNRICQAASPAGIAALRASWP